MRDEPTDALVVCCADPRFRDAIGMFLKDLGVENPVIIAVPGSIKSFGLQAFIPKQWHTLKKQLELMATRNAHVPRVILIAHEECKSYAASAHWIGGLDKVVAAQHEHLIHGYRPIFFERNAYPPPDRPVSSPHHATGRLARDRVRTDRTN